MLLTFLILLGILYLIYQFSNTRKEKRFIENIDNVKKEKKVTFNLGENEYHSYIIPSTSSTMSNDSIYDLTYKINSNNVSSTPNTMVELPTEYASYETEENVTLSSILKKDNPSVIEYQTSNCLNDFRYDGDLFKYENDKSVCSNIPTTNEKVDVFRENSDMYIGKSVADVYDNLVKSEYKKDRKELTNENKFYSYGDNDRKTLRPDRWGYKNEFSINGGAYKGNIYGYDSMVDKQLAI